MRPRPVEGKGHLEMTMAPSRIRRCHCNRHFRVPANLIKTGQWGEKCQTPICRVEKSPLHTTRNVHLWKFFISSANFDGLEWRKKRSGFKYNYMKPRRLAVSSRPGTKPTRSMALTASRLSGGCEATMRGGSRRISPSCRSYCGLICLTKIKFFSPPIISLFRWNWI